MTINSIGVELLDSLEYPQRIVGVALGVLDHLVPALRAGLEGRLSRPVSWPAPAIELQHPVPWNWRDSAPADNVAKVPAAESENGAPGELASFCALTHGT